MPIMASQSGSDARGAAKLLAAAAHQCISDPGTAPQHQVALNNVYRLLETFRTNASFGLRRPARQSSRNAVETLSIMPPAERHVKEVRDALERAIEDSFAGCSIEQAVGTIEDVLRAVAYPNKYPEPSIDDRQKTEQFFADLHRHLQSF